MLKILLIFLFVEFPVLTYSQTNSLRTNLEYLVNLSDGHIGIAVMRMEDGDTLSVNGIDHFPMQSVFKFPLALTVLNQVDSGKFSLDQKIHLSAEDLHSNTWSPLKKKYPDGNVDIPLDEILTQTVAWSDNNGCDRLFRLIGGTAVANNYIHGLGVHGIHIVATEEEMHKEWDVQYQNWSTPVSMMRLLYKFYKGDLLSSRNTEYLWNVMVKTTTGALRIKGMLPQGTIVGHKTGTSDTNKDGLTAATNDVGIITLPNGSHVIIVVFVSDSHANDQERDNVIARIAKSVWDAYGTQH